MFTSPQPATSPSWGELSGHCGGDGDQGARAGSSDWLMSVWHLTRLFWFCIRKKKIVCCWLIKIYAKGAIEPSGQDELGRSGNKSLGAHWLRGFLLTSGQSRVQCQCRLGSCATNTSNSAECRKDAQMALMARVTVTWQMSECNWRHFMVKWSSNYVCGFDIFRQFVRESGVVLSISTTKRESPDQGFSVQICNQQSNSEQARGKTTPKE